MSSSNTRRREPTCKTQGILAEKAACARGEEDGRELFAEFTPKGAIGFLQRAEAVTWTLTGVSQLWRSGLDPLVTAKNSSWSLRVMGPATPWPT